jgi:DNA-binding response OmpR family regulator
VEELKARLRALLRRGGSQGDPDALSFAEIRLAVSRPFLGISASPFGVI